jgi:putative copper export protein/methionine-rich copper-binding protein CopC
MNFISQSIGLYRKRLTSIALSVGLLIPTSLLFHAHLVKSDPAAGTSISSSPKLLRLWFSEAPELALTHVNLVTEKGDTIPLGNVVRDQTGPLAVVASIPGILSPGAYHVLWRTAAADGHPTHGQFTFTVIAGGAIQTAVPSPGRSITSQATAPSAPTISTSSQAVATPFDALSPMYIAIRWLSLAALVIIIGIVAFRLFVLSTSKILANDAAISSMLHARMAQLGLWTAAILGAATLARLTAQSAILKETTVTVILLHTTWGVGWLVQAGALILTLFGFVLARQQTMIQRTGWMLAVMGTLVLAFTPALSGHAIVAPKFTALALLSDYGHVLGAGGWLGSLFVLIVVALPSTLLLDSTVRGATIATLVNRFSRTALIFAALTLVTGTASAWIHLGSVSALWQTGYGRTLLVKLGALAFLIAAGAYNWLIMRPTLDRGDNDGAVRLRRSASLELLIGAVIIAVTAVLIATPTPTW